jgi:predicted DNA-binding transcriptional regulator AlpA
VEAPKVTTPAIPNSALPAEFLTTAEVLAWLRFSRNHLNLLVEEHGFPAPLKVSARGYLYRRPAIENWLTVVAPTLPGKV